MIELETLPYPELKLEWNQDHIALLEAVLGRLDMLLDSGGLSTGWGVCKLLVLARVSGEGGKDCCLQVVRAIDEALDGKAFVTGWLRMKGHILPMEDWTAYRHEWVRRMLVQARAHLANTPK